MLSFTGESGLTTDALAEHNLAFDISGLTVDDDDAQSGKKTFNTVATSFSSCTLPAFNK